MILGNWVLQDGAKVLKHISGFVGVSLGVRMQPLSNPTIRWKNSAGCNQSLYFFQNVNGTLNLGLSLAPTRRNMEVVVIPHDEKQKKLRVPPPDFSRKAISTGGRHQLESCAEATAWYSIWKTLEVLYTNFPRAGSLILSIHEYIMLIVPCRATKIVLRGCIFIFSEPASM